MRPSLLSLLSFSLCWLSLSQVQAQPDPVLATPQHGLTAYEQRFTQRILNCQVIPRPNIVLMFPPNIRAEFPPESRAHNMEGVADWLEAAYGKLKGLTAYDPNDRYQRASQPRNRLVFVIDGTGNFHFGGSSQRPYIGGHSSINGENWFQYISHEMGHDFTHGHPQFSGRTTGWGEGMAEYLRYNLLLAMNMPQAAKRFEDKMATTHRTDPNARYRGRAYQLLLMQRKLGFRDASQFLPQLYGKDINVFMGLAPDETETEMVDVASSLIAAWDFAGKAPLSDKATGGQKTDNLKLLGGATVRDGMAIVPATAGAALQASSSADLSLRGEMTLWIRVRMKGSSRRIISLIDKRHFKEPEARSYGFFLAPQKPAGNWVLGGQITEDGTKGTGIALTDGVNPIKLEDWKELAMVVRGRGDYASVSWFASSTDPEEEHSFTVVNGPTSRQMRGIFQSDHPLLLGNDSTLGNIGVTLEIDEARIYNKALSPEDLANIEPGQFP